MYLTFAEYAALGGMRDEQAYTRLEFAARKMIDACTYNRLEQDETPREAVKMLVFELIKRDMLGSLSGENIASASNDGLSVSLESGAEERARAAALINDYLANEVDAGGVPLLYCGSFA
jgi:transcriptional regulator with XRE-family HTH domain